VAATCDSASGALTPRRQRSATALLSFGRGSCDASRTACLGLSGPCAPSPLTTSVEGSESYEGTSGAPCHRPYCCGPFVISAGGLLSKPAYFLHWGVVQISLANFLVIVTMIVIFVLALVVPFPHSRDVNPGQRDADA
jgi:hypothetical protein